MIISVNLFMSSQDVIYIPIKYKKNYISKEIDDVFDYETQTWKLNINKNLKDNLKDFYFINGIIRSKTMFFYIIKNEKAIKEINIRQPLKIIKNELKDNIIFISPKKIEIINDVKYTEIIDESSDKKPEEINIDLIKKKKDEIDDEEIEEIKIKNKKEVNIEKTNKINNEIEDRKIDGISTLCRNYIRPIPSSPHHTNFFR